MSKGLVDVSTKFTEITFGKSFHSLKHEIVDSDPLLSLDYEDRQLEVIFGHPGEDSKPRKTISLRKLVIEHSNQDLPPLFNYFLDGTRRIYHIDDVDYSGEVFPIVVGQVAISCLKRQQREFGILGPSICHFVLSVPTISIPDKYQGDADLFKRNLIVKLHDESKIQKVSASIGEVFFYRKEAAANKDSDPLNAAKTPIQTYMNDLEIDTVKEIAEKNILDDKTYLLKDGSLNYFETKKYSKRKFSEVRLNYEYVVGVSKRFSPDLLRDRNKKNISSQLASLPLYSRTPVYKYHDRKTNNIFSVWYLRIRPITGRPLDGVVKIEKLILNPNSDSFLESTDLINHISVNIIRERIPTSYGSDERWPNHLYPIHLTERYMKSRLLSKEMVLKIF